MRAEAGGVVPRPLEWVEDATCGAARGELLRTRTLNPVPSPEREKILWGGGEGCGSIVVSQTDDGAPHATE